MEVITKLAGSNGALDSAEALKKELIQNGLNPQNLESGLRIPIERRDLLRSMVIDHLKQLDIGTTNARHKAGDKDFEVLQILVPEQVSLKTPIISRIAHGIDKFHGHARLVIDITGEMLGELNALAAFSPESNTIVIPWSVVLNPDSVNRTSSLGHELKHLNQKTQGEGSILYQELEADGKIQYKNCLHLNEIEPHFFTLRHLVRELPSPNQIDSVPREQLVRKLSRILAETEFLSNQFRIHETVTPLIRESFLRGEPFVRMHQSEEHQTPTYGVMIGRGMRNEGLAIFRLPTKSESDFGLELLRTLDSSNRIVEHYRERVLAIDELARQVLEPILPKTGFFRSLLMAIPAFLPSENQVRLSPKYDELVNKGKEPVSLGQIDSSQRERLGGRNENGLSPAILDADKWIAGELSHRQRAFRGTLTSCNQLKLSVESYRALAAAVMKDPKMAREFASHVEPIMTGLFENGDREGAIEFGQFVVAQVKSPTSSFLNQFARIMAREWGKSDDAEKILKRALKRFRSEGGKKTDRAMEEFARTKGLIAAFRFD